MNVSCPQCSTVYRVDPAKVPQGGVRARCSTCGGVIPVGMAAVGPAARQTPADAMAAAFAPRPAQPGPFVPGASSRPTPARIPAPPPVAPPRAATPRSTPPVATPPSVSRVATPVSAPRIPTPRIPTPRVPTPQAPPRVNTPASVAAAISVPAETPAPAMPVAPAPAPIATATPSTALPASAPSASQTPAPGERRPINPFLARDPGLRATRLARALVSDMVAYYPAKHAEGLEKGTLKELFRDEIKKSYEEYIAQVGADFARSTTHFQESLNEVLGAGRKIF